MFIVNDCNIETISTNLILGQYLVKNGLPLLQKRDKLMIFSKTKKFDEIVDNLPVRIKLLGRVTI